jgi:hypothetical protein
MEALHKLCDSIESRDIDILHQLRAALVYSYQLFYSDDDHVQNRVLSLVKPSQGPSLA